MSDERATTPPPPPPPPVGGGEMGQSSPSGQDGAVGAPRRTSLLRSSMIMASGTMVSRLLGFARNFLLLACIGTGAGSVSAAFGVANNLPNTVYNLLAAGVFDAVLVPQIVRALKSRSGNVYVNRLITLAGTILFAVTLLAMVAAPLLVTLFAKGYTGELRSLSIAFTLLCLPQIFFYGVYNLLGELLNARGIFGPYMWAPVVNNIVGIAGLVTFLVMWGPAPDDGIFHVEDFTSTQFWVLAGTATLGVLLQALVLIIPMRRSGVSLRPDFHFRGTSFGTASKVAGWTFATLGISQIGILSTSNLATQVDTHAAGSDVLMAGIASYTTAFMIYMVPQSLISVSLATAIFTRLANAAAERDGETMAANYHQGVRLITLLSLLAAAILMAGAVPMMQLALPPGASPEVAQAYSWVLLALMPGVASTGMVLMSQRVFFALEDARPVFLMGIVPTLVQVAVGWSIFALAGPQWWTAGASLGETTCRLLQGFIAVFWVARVVREVNPGRIIASYLKFLAAAVVSFAVGLGVVHLLGPVSDPASRLVRYLMAGGKLAVVAVVVTAVYVLVLRLIDPEDAGRVLPSLAQRLPLPAPLRRVMVGRSGGADGDNGLTQDRRTTEGAMQRDQDGADRDAPEDLDMTPVPTGDEPAATPGTTPWGDEGAPPVADSEDEDGDGAPDRVPSGAPGSEDTPDEGTAGPAAGEAEDGAAGDGTRPDHEVPEAPSWETIGAAWSASDPTNTGEFPVLSRLATEPPISTSHADLPSFDEILRPGTAGTAGTAGANGVAGTAGVAGSAGSTGSAEFDHTGSGAPEHVGASIPGHTDPGLPGHGNTPAPDDVDDPVVDSLESTTGNAAEAAGDTGTSAPDSALTSRDGEDRGTFLPAPPPPGAPFEPDTFADGLPASESTPEPDSTVEDADDTADARPDEASSFPPPPPPPGAVTAAGAADAAALGAGVAGAAAAGTGADAVPGHAFASWLERTSRSLRRSAAEVRDRSRTRTGATDAQEPTTTEPADGGTDIGVPAAPEVGTHAVEPDGVEPGPEKSGPEESGTSVPWAVEHDALAPDAVDPAETGAHEDVDLTGTDSHANNDTDTRTEWEHVLPRTPEGEDTTTHGTEWDDTEWDDRTQERARDDRAHERTEVLPAAVAAPGAHASGSGTGAGPAAESPSSTVPPSSTPRPATSTDGGGAGRRKGINPTLPALVFALVLVLGGGVWGVRTALAPIGDLDLPALPSQSGEQSGQQSGDQSGATAEPEEPETATVTPEIATPTVFSWRDDGGDNPDSVINLIDGDPNTEWHSRSYDLNQFREDQTVTILLTLKEKATVSEIDLTMAPETSGGEVVVRNVTDPADPRTGTELTTSALSPQTTIKLPEPTEVSALSLSFRTMPTGPNGENWAWIYELAVK